MQADPTRDPSPDVPYQLGRLFAVLACLHRQAMKGKGADLGERRYSEAATTPAAVLPPLLVQAEAELAKIGRNRAQQLGQLIAELLRATEPMPRQLSLLQQAGFALGYCAQRQQMAPRTAVASGHPAALPAMPARRMAGAPG